MYHYFRTALKDPLSTDEDVKFALGILEGRGKGKDGEGSDKDDEDEGSNKEIKDVEMANETGQPSSLPKPFRILVENAIDEFGYAPRDVYSGVFELRKTLTQHDAALQNLDFAWLKSLAKKFPADHELNGTSDHVVVVHPLPGPPGLDLWETDFKSRCIGKKAVQKMVLIEEERLRDSYQLHCLSASATLAGWIFEAIIHQLFIRGWWEPDGVVPEPTPMTFVKKKRSISFEYSSSALPPPPEIPRPLRTHHTNVIRTSLTDTLDDVTLANNNYYIPTATNNALFDSFVIDHNPGKTARISVFQISFAHGNRGSARSYDRIQKIRNRVGTLLAENEPDATAKIVLTYFLLCPKDGASPGAWEMPGGWSKYSGDVFCVRIPTSGMLRLPTPKFSA